MNPHPELSVTANLERGLSAGPFDPSAPDPDRPIIADDYLQVQRQFLAANPKLITPAIVKRIKEICLKWAEAQADIDGISNLAGRIESRRSAVAKKLNAGEPIPEEALSPSSVVEADVAELRIVGVARQKQLGEAAFTIATEVFPDLLTQMDAWCTSKIQTECDLYATAGVTFDVHRSHLARTCRKSTAQLRGFFESASARRFLEHPKRAFAFLGLDLSSTK